MPAFLNDPGLELPRAAHPAGPAPSAQEGLLRHGRATDRLIVLAGRRSTVDAQGLGGVRRITADGAPLTGVIDVDGPTTANVASTPRSLIRERIGASGGLRETVLVPERLPGAVIQWIGDVSPKERTVKVRLPEPMTGAGRYRAEGGTLRWTTAPNGTGGVLQLSGDQDGEWSLVEREGGWWANASFSVGPDTPATLLVSAVRDPDRLPSLPALAALRAHRRRDELEPEDTAGLRLETGMPDLDEGVGWARATLRATLADRRGDQRLRWADEASTVAAALAAGEWEVARAVLAHSMPSEADADARARWMAWTGKPRPLLDARPGLDPVLAEAPQPLRGRVADAAEAAGDEDWAAALRMVVTRDGGRRLPTLRAASPAAALPAASLPTGNALAGRPRPERDAQAGEGPAEADGPPTARALRAAIPSLRSSDPDPGTARLMNALSWAHREASVVEADAAGATLQLLVEGLLGIKPDAAYGRIGLSPCLPESWEAFHVRGIQLGDAIVGMEMTREGHTYRFALRQLAGGAPVTWIFAPRLPGVRIARVRVDGEEALVDSRPVGRRIEPRIQIPAERERLVEIELTPP